MYFTYRRFVAIDTVGRAPDHGVGAFGRHDGLVCSRGCGLAVGFFLCDLNWVGVAKARKAESFGGEARYV